MCNNKENNTRNILKQIDDLKEYLSSAPCKNCEYVANKLQNLIDLLESYDADS